MDHTAVHFLHKKSTDGHLIKPVLGQLAETLMKHRPIFSSHVLTPPKSSLFKRPQSWQICSTFNVASSKKTKTIFNTLDWSLICKNDTHTCGLTKSIGLRKKLITFTSRSGSTPPTQMKKIQESASLLSKMYFPFFFFLFP